MHFNTKVIHAGIKPDPATGGIMTPIYQTTTFVQSTPGVHKGYEYARAHNPTRTVLQDNLAALENTKYGLCFSTGMGAIDAVAKLLKPGDHVLATNELYGGSFRIFTQIFETYGIEFTFTDMTQLTEAEKQVKENTKLIWIETPTNPTLSIIDIEACAKLAKAKRAILVIDNTFASPALQTPINLGADIVMNSVTKFIGGHSDVVMGALCMNCSELYEKLRFIQNACGATPGPQDCFLALRGIKTLHLRMQRHCENGQAVADYLAQHPKVAFVNYPGHIKHPGHNIAKNQMSGFGGMMSFGLKADNIENAFQFLSSTHLFSLAESLGGVESLVGHPASMTHAAMPKEQRMQSGITDSLIRISVGVEYIDDLIADLDQAFENI